jgi:single-stranded-DNA-specific exonuclease
VIITDHHEAPEILPDAYAIINPKAPNALDESLSSQQIISMNYLAGVGVAYKLATALLEEYSQESFVRELLPLAAIGTVGDVVPILFENRSLVKLGIEAIKESGSLGIKKLMEVSSADAENFDAETIAFSLVPRINAAGRLDHAHCAVELLISENPDVVSLGAEKLQNLNVLRQTYCQKTCEQALEELQNVDLKKNKAIILYNKEWNAGIIGIVASKLSETFIDQFLMTSDEKYLRCSARGIEGLNLYETLCEN